MYETLVGFVPFDGADIYSITSKHLEEMPVSPEIVDSRVPAALAGVVMRCLAKNPAARYARGNDVADALIQYLAQYRRAACREARWLAVARAAVVRRRVMKLELGARAAQYGAPVRDLAMGICVVTRT